MASPTPPKRARRLLISLKLLSLSSLPVAALSDACWGDDSTLTASITLSCATFSLSIWAMISLAKEHAAEVNRQTDWRARETSRWTDASRAHVFGSALKIAASACVMVGLLTAGATLVGFGLVAGVVRADTPLDYPCTCVTVLFGGFLFSIVPAEIITRITEWACLAEHDVEIIRRVAQAKDAEHTGALSLGASSEHTGALSLNMGSDAHRRDEANDPPPDLT